MKWHWFIAGLVLAGCCDCPPATSITPKPNVAPIAASSKKIRESAHKIHASTQEAMKVNTDVQGDINSADEELKKLLKK